jgi:hypothetical protein
MRLFNEDIIRELNLRLECEKSLSKRVHLKRLIEEFNKL